MLMTTDGQSSVDHEIQLIIMPSQAIQYFEIQILPVYLLI